MAVIVADESDNVNGAAATTASGSIGGSSTMGQASLPSGDKTVRKCFTSGVFRLTSAGLTQACVGQTAYAVDNDVVSLSKVGMKVGTIVRYESATSCFVDLNKFYEADGTFIISKALTAVTGTTAGGVVSIQNNTGRDLLVEDLYLNITTKASGTVTADFGVASTVASADNLLDGTNLETTGIHSIVTFKGTNGGQRIWVAGEYLTGTASASAAGLVGTAYAKVRVL